jgi:RNA polymerase sigma-70 factor (ECF subfamily)
MEGAAMSNIPDTGHDLRRLPEWNLADSGVNANGEGEEARQPDALERRLPVMGDIPAPTAEKITDEQLFERYRQGDRTSFATLMERHHRELFHFLVRFLGNRAAAEDTFQETFLQVHRSAAGFDAERRFRTWLFTIAANKARDLLRSQGRHPTIPLQASVTPGNEESGQFMDFVSAGGDLPAEAMERHETAERVRSTVMDMPGNLREILLLSYFNQFPYNQISDILGVPLGTVKSRLHSAVAEFGNRWKMMNKEPRGA